MAHPDVVSGRFKTGARPSPPHRLLAAAPYRIRRLAPTQFSYVPAKLDMWGNNQYGDCVTAEEAFAKACYLPEIFIDARTVINWAQQNGFLDGADLSSVLDAMKSNGFVVGPQTYDDGNKLGVDYSNAAILQAAISDPNSAGPVKIAISSSDLPSSAGNQMGWHAFGRSNGRSTDHCVSLSGYGTAAYCFQALGVPLPTGVDPNKPDCYHLYTWSTIGVVDFAWIQGTCAEAWTRQPTTVGVPPLPGPHPVPTGNLLQVAISLAAGSHTVADTTLTLGTALAAGSYPIDSSPNPVVQDVKSFKALADKIAGEVAGQFAADVTAAQVAAAKLVLDFPG